MKKIIFTFCFLFTNVGLAQEYIAVVDPREDNLYLCNSFSDADEDKVSDTIIDQEKLNQFIEVIMKHPEESGVYQVGKKHVLDCVDMGGTLLLVKPINRFPGEMGSKYGCVEYICSSPLIDEEPEDCLKRVETQWLNGRFFSYADYSRVKQRCTVEEDLPVYEGYLKAKKVDKSKSKKKKRKSISIAK